MRATKSVIKRPSRTMFFGIYENRAAVSVAKVRARNAYPDPNVKLTIVKKQGYSVKITLPKKRKGGR